MRRQDARNWMSSVVSPHLTNFTSPLWGGRLQGSRDLASRLPHIRLIQRKADIFRHANGDGPSIQMTTPASQGANVQRSSVS